MKIISDKIMKRFSNTVGERNEVDEVLAPAIFCQDILGQNILDPNWNWKTKMAKQFIIIILVVHVVMGTKEYLKHETDTTSVSEAYFVSSASTILAIKYFIFVNSRKNIQKSYLIAKTTMLKIIETVSIEKSKGLMKKLSMIVQFLFFSVIVPVSAHLLPTIWKYIMGRRENMYKISTLMPMTSPYYEIGFILHASYYCVGAFTTLVIDLWFIILLVFFCSTSDSLVTMLKVEHNESVETKQEYMDRLNDKLKAFYENHIKLMEFFNILSDIYKWPALIPLVSILSTWCLILLSMSEQVQWSFLTTVVPAIMQIFGYNWFGEQVKIKTSQLTMALLEFDWLSMRNKDKKNYLIIVTYMNKEFGIKTAFGNELSLITMTSVLKAGYQAYTLLRSTRT